MKILKLSVIVLAVLAMVVFSCKSNDDPAPSDPDPVLISAMDLSIDEGNDYNTALITFRLDASSDQQITANISTSEGTAEANKDYIPLDNQPVVFAPGETTKTYEITIAGDLILEGDEYFEVTIASVAGPATIDKATARVDLLNEDVAGPQEIQLSYALDWDAVVNLATNSEIPYDVFNFGQPSNVPNAEFTSVGTVSDTIYFGPKFSASGDTLLYSGIFFEPGFDWPTYVDLIFMDLTPSDSVQLEIQMPIINDDLNDLEFKYDIHIMIGTDQGRFGPYIIDPKIRIQI